MKNERRTMIIGEKNGIPIILCKAKRRTSHGLETMDWVFYCEHCRCNHTHGPKAGHRSSHCRAGSPFKEKGYYISLGKEGT